MNVYSPRLQYLLEQYAGEACTDAETEELMLIIRQAGHEEEIKNFIEHEISKGAPASLNAGQQLSPGRAEMLFRKIMMKQKSAPVKIAHKWRLAAAAAVLAGIIGTLSYFLLTPAKTKSAASTQRNRPPVANDVLPGTKGAVLTLSNGQQIVLDSAANGLLASQGHTIIINKNGQIAYNVKGNIPGDILYNTMTTPRGRQYQLLLSDGTKVWLNAESSIRYPADFTGNTRTVSMSGEAYFEVAKNEKIPFIVKVNGIEVKVMGTHFNINAYTDESSIKTTLLEGRVNVLLEGSNKNIFLAPGQQVKVSKTGGPQLTEHADVEEAIAWKDGIFQFNKSDIQTVMRQIARWYDLEISYEGEIPKDRFGGKLPMDAKVSQILAALEQTQVHFKIEGKRIIVMP